MNEQVACDGTTQIPGLIFCPRRAPLYLFPFCLFSLAFTLPLALKTQCFFLLNLQLSPAFPLALHTHCTLDVGKRIANTWCTYTYSDLPDETYSLELLICPLAWSIQEWLPCLDHFPPKTIKTVDLLKFRHTHHLSLTNIIYFGPSNLAWFVGDGGNN